MMHIKDLIDRYLDQLAMEVSSGTRSSATLAYYRDAYKPLTRFVAAAGGETEAERWTRWTMDKYRRWLAAAGELGPQSGWKYAEAVRRLFRWAEEVELLGINPLAKYKLRRVRSERVRGYSRDDVDKLAAACPSTPLGLRDLTLLLLDVETGLRAGELRAPVVGDLDLDQRTVWVARGKGGKSRTVDVAADVVELLRAYLASTHPAPTDRTAPLFPTRLGGHFSRTGLHQRITALKEAAGIPGRGGMHRLRHSCAELRLLRGAPLPFIQDHLGHADIQTTRRYIDFTRGQMRDLAQRTSPVADLAKAATSARRSEGR